MASRRRALEIAHVAHRGAREHSLVVYGSTSAMLGRVVWLLLGGRRDVHGPTALVASAKLKWGLRKGEGRRTTIHDVKRHN